MSEPSARKSPEQAPFWRNALVLGLTLGAVLLIAPACQFAEGRVRLARLLRDPAFATAYGRTVFRSGAPEGGPEHPLAALEATLAYWSAAGADGEPRWRGVLEPEPADLYRRLLARIEAGAASLTLIAYRYDAVGLDVLTLVEYRDENGAFLGRDHVPYGERSAAPRSPGTVGYDDLSWWECLQFALDAPVYAAIGIKEFAGEVVKSPLNALYTGAVGSAVSGFSPLSLPAWKKAALAFAEDWRDGLTALAYRFRVRNRHTPFDLASDLAAALPLVGPFLERRSSPPGIGKRRPTRNVFLSQGIDGGDETLQAMAAWEKATRESRPATPVVTLPYRYGDFLDVVWSLLNLSNGAAHAAAAQIVLDEGVRAGEAVDLVGFSGGAQRFVSASRILRASGVAVNRLVGVAGPCGGASCALEGHVLLGDDAIADAVVLAAHVVNGLFVLLPAGIQSHRIEGAGGHHTPFLPHPLTRAPRLGYAGALDALLAE